MIPLKFPEHYKLGNTEAGFFIGYNNSVRPHNQVFLEVALFKFLARDSMDAVPRRVVATQAGLEIGDETREF